MFSVATTRFNSATFDENQSWRKRHAHEGCVYGVMKPITTATIPLESYLFVLEMNNETNENMGVGLIQNMIEPKENVRIYSNPNYCYYAYHSPYRVDRAEFPERTQHVVAILEILVFKGSTHMKRGQGITVVPEALLLRGKMDFVFELAQVFKQKYKALTFDGQSLTVRRPG